ncbi:TPA: ATP-binding protein [Pseudomonas aeruginosa]
MSSLQHRTLLGVMILLLTGTTLLAIYSYHDGSHEIAEIYDAHMAQNARLLQGVMSIPMGDTSRDALYSAFDKALRQSRHVNSTGHPYENKLAFQIWSENGEILVHTASAPIFSVTDYQFGYSNFRIEGHEWRGFLLPVPEQKISIWVGERSDVRGDLVGRVVRHTLLPYVLGSLVLASLVWFTIGRGLRPLRNMEKVIRARHAGSLEPLQLAHLPKELDLMQSALNRLLNQVNIMLNREHRFIADAAHEMRTPLAILRLHAQNALQASNKIECKEALNFLIGGVDRLHRVVSQLLTLARIGAQSDQGRWKPLSLEAVLTETLAELTPWILRQGIEPMLDIKPGDYHLESDADAIAIALQNLVINATNFSPVGSTVRISLLKTNGEFEIIVEDQGPGMPEDRLEQAFHRFYSEDNENGSGLGLSIVRAIMDHLEGTVCLENKPNGGMIALLRIRSKSRNL